MDSTIFILLNILIILKAYECVDSHEQKRFHESNVVETFCTKKYNCTDTFYYSFDGTCNNLLFPWLGSTNTPFKRLLPSRYDNLKNEPRTKSTCGKPLPSPSLVSKTVDASSTDVDSDLTVVAAMFGQFLAHDLALSLSARNDCNTIACLFTTDCMDIIKSNSDFNVTNGPLLNSIKSRTKGINIDWKCRQSCREQVNGATHWLDLSHIYGNDKATSDSLRTMTDGLLKTSSINGLPGEYLPFARHGTCNSILKTAECFRSGDVRVNLNMLFEGIVTIFVREHNYIARQLKQLYPKMIDEELFKNTRRLLIAEYQHIVYNEWLPVILGHNITNAYSLKPLKAEGKIKYNPQINPQISNEFTTAAFRFGHSMLKSYFTKRDENYQLLANVSFTRLTLDGTEAFVDGGTDTLCLGAIIDKAKLVDSHITDALHKHLFENIVSREGVSMDMIDINRGREHGLATYNEYRGFCGLQVAQDFSDLTSIPADVIMKLKKVYRSVNDIDLYTGGLSETPLKGAAVGETFACLIAKQFKDLKFGDKNFYESGKLEQNVLTNIKVATFSRLYCRNMNNIKKVPKFGFRILSQSNKLTYCKDI